MLTGDAPSPNESALSLIVLLRADSYAERSLVEMFLEMIAGREPSRGLTLTWPSMLCFSYTSVSALRIAWRRVRSVAGLSLRAAVASCGLGQSFQKWVGE